LFSSFFSDPSCGHPNSVDAGLSLESAAFVRFVRHPLTFAIALNVSDPMPRVFVGRFLLLSPFERRRAVSVANRFFSARSVF
jgi:hypothetical protein